jgi:hypothetical protein
MANLGLSPGSNGQPDGEPVARKRAHRNRRTTGLSGCRPLNPSGIHTPVSFSDLHVISEFQGRPFGSRVLGLSPALSDAR